MRETTTVFDHLIWAVPDLDGATTRLATATGASATAGGRHPGIGTHNALCGLEGACYFEILALDPSQSERRSFGRLVARLMSAVAAPRLFGWAIRTEKLEPVADAARRAGLAPGEMISMERRRPDGGVLRWRLMDLGVGEDPLRPLVIEWAPDTAHPGAALPAVGRLEELGLEHPDPASAEALLDTLGVCWPGARPTLTAGPKSRWRAVFAGPSGRLELAG